MGATIMVKQQWKEILEKIMSDNKPRSPNGILDLMWEDIETENKKRLGIGGGSTPITGRKTIPTKMQIIHYMSKSPDYDCAVFDIINNRMTKSKRTTTGMATSELYRPYEKRYWRVK